MLGLNALELRIVSAKLPVEGDPPTTHARFSWELEGASPAVVRTESVKASHTPTYDYCGTFAFERKRKSSISFFKFKR